MKTRQYKFRAIVYKAPAQDTGKIILAGAVGNWDNSQAAFTAGQGHSFAKTLEHVVGTHASVKFLAYNNVPPGIPNVKTKSNSKGVIILSTAADSAAWVVHTIPGFPTAKTPYAWPASETARGHLLICLTISKSQINAIAASLLLAQPVIHYNDIPETETAGMPYFKKLTEGKTRVMPPFTSRRTIRTKNGGAPVTVHIYSKSETSKYEMYKKVIVKALKKTIKVWSRRDSKLKGDCRVPERHIRLLKSPGVINGHNTNIEADDTNWAVSDPGSVICHVDKPYFKNQSKEPAMAICIENNDIFTRFNEIAAQYKYRAIVYKAPGQNTGKIILASAAGNWDDGAVPLSNNAGHSFAATLEHVVQANNDIKFLAYNNVPPAVPNVKTKSNSKGVIIVRTTANVDSAAWVVHTIPGFPTAKTPYTWPAAENARGHLLICLTISESQINAIAASLLLVQPMIHYNDIPETETAGMPYFKKLAEGQTPIIPPFTSKRSIRTQNPAAPVTVHIYSKSESSKYEIYKKVIVKALKKTIKVWSRRDNKLKGDCRVPERHIRLLKSPGVINGHNTNLEADDTNWAVSDPGSKNQSREPAMAVCIENNDIFTRFNEIAAQKRSSAIKGTASIINVGGPFHEASVFRVKNGYSPGQYRRFSAMLEPFHGMLLVVLLLPQAVSKDVENDLSEPVTDAVSENCEMEQSENVLNEELDRHVEQEKKPKQLVMLIQIEREKPKSGLYVEYTAEMKFRVNEKSVQMYKPRLKKTVNVADAGMNAVQSFIY
ncbi:Deoxyribonuclease-2-beta [Trichinella spiralis]|uniref:Deoxyribonuclease-2-beta n=1 Tax=Trichinella spiralis TaxID=6334 RepID=A0A0V1BKX0_TRISP|nr:Deoxyribonuclease-2-beta [Trichinella spiralis]